MKGWEQGEVKLRRQRRSQANVLAVVLLAGMVLAGATLVVYAGTQALEQRQGDASFEKARQSVQSLGATIDEVSDEGSTAEISMSELDRGEASIEQSAGRITLDVEGGPNVTRTLGKVVYEQDGQSLAYQGGGVFETSGEGGSAVVSAPPFTYRREGPSATLTLPVVSVRGESVDDSLRIERTGVTELLPENDTLRSAKAMTVTVQTEYYRAWGAVIEGRVDVNVSYDDSASEVSFRLESADDSSRLGGDISGAVVSPGSVGSIANHGSFDSYDDVYQGSMDRNGNTDLADADRKNGDVRIDGELKLTKQEIGGDAHATEGITSSKWKFEIGGDLVLGTESGTVEIGPSNGNSGKVEIEKTLSTKTDLVVNDADELGGIIAGGTADISGVSSGISGDVHAHDDAVIENDVDGDVIVDGDVTIERATVQGDIKANGSVMLNNAAVIGSLDQNATVSGALADPIEPSVPSFKSATDLIKEKETEYETNGNNDNADKPGLIDTYPGSAFAFDCDTSCSLDAGEYAVRNLWFSGDLTVDTSNGDVHVFVNKYVNIQGKITVEGGGQLFVYVDGDEGNTEHFMIDGEVITKDDIDGDGVSERSYNASKVWTYIEPDLDVDFSTQAAYTGVLYAADDSGIGADFAFSNHADVYGAVIGVLGDLNNHPAIHYDERLADASTSPDDGGSGGDGGNVPKPNVIYVETSERTVEVS